jgi:hypothetical protein
VRLGALALASSVTFLVGQRALACAGCSNPNLPVAREGAAALGAGQLSVALNLSATTLHVVHAESCPEIGPICRERAEPPQLHDQRFYAGELRSILGYGVTSQLGLELQLPLRVIHTTIRFRRLDGTAFEPDYENIHHRNETLFGLADPWLLGRVSGQFGNLALASRGGVGLPAGSTEEDPFARGRAGLRHQHIQFGTGTFHPIFAVDASLTFGRTRLSAYAQEILFAYENEHGYQPGNRFSAGISGDVELAPSFRAGIGADVLNEQPERWHGLVQQDGNVGRTDILFGGMLSYALGSVLASLSVKVPVWQHFIATSHAPGQDPGQLTYPAIVNLALATSFGGAKRALPKSGTLEARVPRARAR